MKKWKNRKNEKNGWNKKMKKWKNEKMKKCTVRDATSSSFAAALRDGRIPHSHPQLRGLRHFCGKPTSRASIEPRSAAFVSALCRECCKLCGIGECCLLRCLMLHKLQWITQSDWLDRHARLLGVTFEWFVDEVCGDGFLIFLMSWPKTLMHKWSSFNPHNNCWNHVHLRCMLPLSWISDFLWSRERTFNNCVASCRGSEWIGDHILVGGDTCESIQWSTPELFWECTLDDRANGAVSGKNWNGIRLANTHLLMISVRQSSYGPKWVIELAHSMGQSQLHVLCSPPQQLRAAGSKHWADRSRLIKKQIQKI